MNRSLGQRGDRGGHSRIDVRGPGSSFTCLFNAQPAEGVALHPGFAAIYGAWPLPQRAERPFTFTNFVMSHDGRVSFNEPGHLGGGDVSRHSAHDRWLMGLLRARADAVLVGGTSIEAAGNHVWTPAAVFPDDAAAFAALRKHEGREATPLMVVLTRSGSVPAHAPSLDDPTIRVLVASNVAGVERARSTLGNRDHVQFVSTGAQLDAAAVLQTLRNKYGVRSLLCEAGPQVYGSLLQQGLIDDAFLTISPIIIGASEKQPRPSLIEGTAFGYAAPPQQRLLSVHRYASYLFLHSRIEP